MFLAVPVHVARWCAPREPQFLFDTANEHDVLAKARQRGEVPPGEPAEWGPLQWASLFREPQGPTVRPVPAWQAGVRLLLAHVGVVDCVDVLLSNAARHGQVKLSHGQEAPAALDVRRALAMADSATYDQAVAVALEHRQHAARRRLAAYLFADQPWWRDEATQTSLMELAPLPRDLTALPAEAPAGLDALYATTVAVAYGDAGVARVQAWIGSNSHLAHVLTDLNTDASIQAWLFLWHAHAATDPRYREGITPLWTQCPVRLLRAAVQLVRQHPGHHATVSRWLQAHGDAAQALRSTLVGDDADLFDAMLPSDHGLPSDWAHKVVGSRRFAPPPTPALAVDASARQTPARLSAAGRMVEPPRSWSREQAVTYLHAVGPEGWQDLVQWVANDAGCAAAVALMVDAVGDIGREWHVPGAAAVRNALSRTEEDDYDAALAVAEAARARRADTDLHRLTAYLFPDQSWWQDAVHAMADEPDWKRNRAIAQLVPLPASLVDLPVFAPRDLSHLPLLPGWLWAYGADLEPLMLEWLGQCSTSDAAIVRVLLNIGSAEAVKAVVDYAYAPFDGYREPSFARERLNAHGNIADVMVALAGVDGPDAAAALHRVVSADLSVARTVDHPAVQVLVREATPPSEPAAMSDLPACFQVGLQPTMERRRIPRVTVEPSIRFSALEQDRIDRLRHGAQNPTTGFDQCAARVLRDGPGALRAIAEQLGRQTVLRDALMVDLGLLALHEHGQVAARAVRAHCPPIAAMGDEAALEKAIRDASVSLFDVHRAHVEEPLSEYHLRDAWRTRSVAFQTLRRHAEAACPLLVWAAFGQTARSGQAVQMRVDSNDLLDLFDAFKKAQGHSGPPLALAEAARAVVPCAMQHMGEWLTRAAESMGVHDVLVQWVEQATFLPVRGADSEWLQASRLPWLTLKDGRVLPRQAAMRVVDLLAGTRADQPHALRDEALSHLSQDSSESLSRALLSFWMEELPPDAFGSWVLSASIQLDPDEGLLAVPNLLASPFEAVRDAAMDALFDTAYEFALISQRLSPTAFGDRWTHMEWADVPPAAWLEARLNRLRTLRGVRRWSPPMTAQAQSPPNGMRDDRFGGLMVPVEQFGALANTGWMPRVDGSSLYMALSFAPGMDVALELSHSRNNTLRLGRLAVRDRCDSQATHALSIVPSQVWGQAVADLSALTRGLAASDKASAAEDIAQKVSMAAMQGKWVCKWLARGSEAPDFILKGTWAKFDASLRDLSDAAAPFGGFIKVNTDAAGLFAATWDDGEVVVVGEPPDDATGLAQVILRAREHLVANG